MVVYGASFRPSRRPTSWELCSQTLALQCTMCVSLRLERSQRTECGHLGNFVWTRTQRGLRRAFPFAAFVSRHWSSGAGWENSASGVTDGIQPPGKCHVDVVSRIVLGSQIVFQPLHPDTGPSKRYAEIVNVHVGTHVVGHFT